MAILALLGVAWTITWASGGTTGPMVHLFYVPVMVAATRFGVRGAALVGATAGILAGPLMPLDVVAGLAQVPTNWGMRLAFFVMIGVIVAFLSTRSLTNLGESLAAAATSAELRRALEQRELRVVYQPIFDMGTGRLDGAEALVRWDHPDRGPISPGEFIPDAERSGMIVPLGLYVLRQSVRQAAMWRSRLPEDSPFSVSVNLSARQLAEPDIVEQIAACLEVAGLPGHALHVEVTESALVEDIDVAAERIAAISQLGVLIALDDFGTGQSSLAYLHRFPVDVLKIDRSFVSTVEDRSTALLAGIIALASGLGAITVAEGIETEAEADTLRVLGCHQAQGFYYARPRGVSELDRILSLAEVIRVPEFRLVPVEPSPGPVGAMPLRAVHPIP
ncbi:MAG TPA: EAL domain-containing protein [Acidimicrobiales bacterium]|nr:EAL domain-containing protein [Acidimicrobiales bacterium]